MKDVSRGIVRLSVLASRARSQAVFLVLDVAVILASYTLAQVAALRQRAPEDYWPKLILFLAVALAVQLVANEVMGLYGRIWRHAGFEEARNIVLSVVLTLVVLLLIYPWRSSMHIIKVPLEVLPFGALMTMVGMGLPRFHSRLLGWQRANREMGLRVGIVGSGQRAADVVRSMLRTADSGLFPVAVFDEDTRTHGLSLMGVPVVGAIGDLPALAEKLHIQQLLVADADMPSDVLERCITLAEAARITVKVVSGVHEIVGSPKARSVAVRAAREPRIEDLLGRHQVVTDLAAVRQVLQHRRILVTGAGGSIGSEICRQVAEFDPELLVMLDHDETHLHDAAQGALGKTEQVLADISCRDAIDSAFERWRPEVVFHAAAHKHVPILETHVVEAVTTNVFGTRNVLEAAAAFGTERFVLVSTDKAVRPSSVMGATKRLGEELLIANAPPDLPYCAVRFGNVLGSRGSVIPTFRRQIASGGPVTVTDPQMTRFFMSVEEAVQLVLQASVLAQRGDIYMLEMGEPISILHLAERMIRLSGLEPGTDIPIRVIGARVGEKVHEDLHGADEQLRPTEHPSILRLHRPELTTIGARLPVGLAELQAAADDRNEVRSRRTLFDLVSEEASTKVNAEVSVVVDKKTECLVPEPMLVGTELSA